MLFCVAVPFDLRTADAVRAVPEPVGGVRRRAAIRRVTRSCFSRSGTVTIPNDASFAWNFGPTIGMSARLNVRRNSASVPGATTCTPSPVVPGLRLGPLDRHLGDQLVRAAAKRDRHAGLALHRGADPVRRVAERLVMVDRLGAAHVEVPLVDARPFDDRRELLEDGADLLVLDASTPCPAPARTSRSGRASRRARWTSPSARRIAALPRTPSRRRRGFPACRRRSGAAPSLRLRDRPVAPPPRKTRRHRQAGYVAAKTTSSHAEPRRSRRRND